MNGGIEEMAAKECGGMTEMKWRGVVCGEAKYQYVWLLKEMAIIMA
jgi:hypothetical protein